MWLEALDLVLQRLKEKGAPFQQIKGISGAGQQHGSVYWSKTGEEILGNLDAKDTLVDQLTKAFAHPFSPNWQDGSTQKECDKYDAELGSAEKLAELTGSKAHHVSRMYGSHQTQLTQISASLDLKSCVCTQDIPMSTVLHLALRWYHRFSLQSF